MQPRLLQDGPGLVVGRGGGVTASQENSKPEISQPAYPAGVRNPLPRRRKQIDFCTADRKGRQEQKKRGTKEKLLTLPTPSIAVEVDPKRRENEDAGAAGPKVGKPLNDF